MSDKFLAEKFDEDLQPDFIPEFIKIHSMREFVWALVELFWSATFILLLTEFIEKL